MYTYTYTYTHITYTRILKKRRGGRREKKENGVERRVGKDKGGGERLVFQRGPGSRSPCRSMRTHIKTHIRTYTDIKDTYKDTYKDKYGHQGHI